MAGPRTEEHPLAEEPTQELPAARGSASDPARRVAVARRIAYAQMAAEVRNHRRAARSGAVPVTPADRRLYQRLERLDQPN